MKKYKSIVLITLLLITISLVNCSSKESSMKVNLGDKYFYLKLGQAMDTNIYSGDGIMYNCILLEDPIVFPEIASYKFNKNFITCKQVYNKNLSSTLLSSGIESRFRRQYYNENETKRYPAIANYVAEFLNDSFIDSICKKLKNNDRILFSKSFSDSIVSSNILFLKMEKQKINYYIIDKKNKRNYLALTKREFDILKEDLKIPDSLSID